MITSIKFDKKTFETYSIVKDENLNNLNRINVFIGKNNSGKSRFLRLLLKKKFDVETKDFNSSTLNDHIKQLKNHILDILNKNQNNPNIYPFRQALEELPKITYANSNKKIEELKNSIETLSNNFYSRVNDGTIKLLKEQTVKYINRFNEDSISFNKTYIPILRGLRPVQTKLNSINNFDLDENNYLKRSSADYSIEINEKTSVHTGLDLYHQVTKLLLGKHSDRVTIKRFEEYLSTTFFQGDDVNIIPMIERDVLHIKIGDEEDYPIYDLGEGIQSIILLTYPLFFNEGKKMLFFIEEPELHLHPGLERVLIETMRDPRFESFQYFITTHSNHILDLTIEYDDISVYSFQKKIDEKGNSFLIQNVSSNHKQVLDLLGVRNSSVFLANCTIWVEGITDRLYLKKYIEVLQKERERIFKEDYHYAFIEYGGNNITHWSFLEIDDDVITTINTEGICTKIFLIVDNDGVSSSGNKKSKKQLRHEQLKEKLENFYVTEGREIENLLSKDIVKQVVQEIEGVNSKLDFSSFDSSTSYSKTGLGKFIAEKVKGVKSTSRYHSKSETINSKLAFCKKAISRIDSVDDLSEEAKELGNLILAFIESSNSKTY